MSILTESQSFIYWYHNHIQYTLLFAFYVFLFCFVYFMYFVVRAYVYESNDNGKIEKNNNRVCTVYIV